MKRLIGGLDGLARHGGGAGRGWAILAGALAISVGFVWLVSGTGLLAATYAGGLATLVALGATLARARQDEDGAPLAPPDWTVTAAALEGAGDAIAVTDRANRLVCANRLFAEQLGYDRAPPNLAVSDDGRELLLRLSRQAWRDGGAGADALAGPDETRRWRLRVERAGRADDYLIWRFHPLTGDDAVHRYGELIAGPLGAKLGRAGVEAALVGPAGVVRAVSPGFAERAAGDRSATLAGQDFVTLLRSDEEDRIYFAREGRRGTPHALVQVPLGDPVAGGPVAGGPVADGAPDAPAPGDPVLFLLLASGMTPVAAGSGAPDATPQLEALLAALPLGLALANRDGRFLYANTAFLRAIDREEEGVPTYPSDLVVGEDRKALSDAVRRFGKGPANSGDIAVRLRDTPGDLVSLGLAGVRGLGDAAVLLSLTDSTEENRLKREMAQATKMQAVGQLAGGVAHDFNNVLTAIIGYCDLMLLRHTPGDGDYDDIQQIKTNSNRAASLTRQLLAFSRQQTLRPEILQLPDVMSEVSQLLRRLLGEKIELRVRHDRDLGPVRADPGQLEQVIVNLAVNARDAIQTHGSTQGPMQGSMQGERPGVLAMTTRRVEAKDVRTMSAEILPVADYTALIVQDTGGGIPPELLGKIFEPFFTTKELGKGTGLGLSTVYGIVKQSGGFVFASNTDGADGLPRGARFTIYLPVHHGAPAPAARGRDPEDAPRDWSAGGRVLLVEDEDTVRLVAERALARAGYTVTACADGEDGLAEVAEGGEFDLVVSDVVMPGMDGPAMVRAIRQLAPGLPVLFMSGYAEEQLRRDIDVPAMYFIPKPFNVRQISEKVGAIMRTGRDGR